MGFSFFVIVDANQDDFTCVFFKYVWIIFLFDLVEGCFSAMVVFEFYNNGRLVNIFARNEWT
ncbi:MAG: hypothetical protein LUD17_02680 [Bacteroidales bacterium]|nr:hypothetical protein [Bacteroidales bacterium]